MPRAVGAVVNGFYDRVLADERVAHHFEDADASAQRSHQTRFLSAVTGGPMRYEGDETETAHGSSTSPTRTASDAYRSPLSDSCSGPESPRSRRRRLSYAASSLAFVARETR